MTSISNPLVRAQVLRNLETLAERYPNLPLSVILSDALAGKDMPMTSDVDLAVALNQIFVTYTQLEAAGLERRV